MQHPYFHVRRRPRPTLTFDLIHGQDFLFSFNILHIYEFSTLERLQKVVSFFSIVKFASGPYASTLILKALSSQKSTKGGGGPRGLYGPGLPKVTVFCDYPLYIFFIFMVVGAQFQEFTVFNISPVCERSIIDKILNQSFFVSHFLSIN